MHEWWKKLRFMYELDKDKYFYSEGAVDPLRWTFYQGVPPVFMSLSVFNSVVDTLGTDE